MTPLSDNLTTAELAKWPNSKGHNHEAEANWLLTLPSLRQDGTMLEIKICQARWGAQGPRFPSRSLKISVSTTT